MSDITTVRIQKQMFEFIEIIRNGAIIAGDTSITNAYRQACIEHAYWRLCRNIAPELLAHGLIEDTNEVKNLLDIGALYQQGLIRPDLKYRNVVEHAHIIQVVEPIVQESS